MPLESWCWSLYKWCPLNIFWFLCLKVAKLGTVDAPYRVEIPYWFSGHNVKVQGQTAGLHPKRCLFIISWPFVWWWNLLHWLTLKRNSLVTRSRSNYWSSFQHYLLNIWWVICLIITKLGTVVASTEWIVSLYAYNPFEICTRVHICFSIISW